MTDTEAVRQALDQLEDVRHELVKTIGALDDPQAAFDAASEVRETLRQMHDEIAELRTTAVGEIWERDQLSLAKLADRIGVSKARADEMIRTVKRRRESNV